MGRRSRQKRERRMAEQKPRQVLTTVSKDKFTPSNKLAYALSCLEVIPTIVLFVVDKTPLVVIFLLVFIMVLAVYPVIYFFHTKWSRTVALIAIAVSIAIFGVFDWPKSNFQTGFFPQDGDHPKQPAPKLNSGNPAPAPLATLPPKSNTPHFRSTKKTPRPLTEPNREWGRELVSECPTDMQVFHLSDSTVSDNGGCAIQSTFPVCLIIENKTFIQRNTGGGVCINSPQPSAPNSTSPGNSAAAIVFTGPPSGSPCWHVEMLDVHVEGFSGGVRTDGNVCLTLDQSTMKNGRGSAIDIHKNTSESPMKPKQQK
jgi:hypothetical protein